MGTPLHDFDEKITNRYRKAVYELGEIAVKRYVYIYDFILMLLLII